MYVPYGAAPGRVPRRGSLILTLGSAQRVSLPRSSLNDDKRSVLIGRIPWLTIFGIGYEWFGLMVITIVKLL